MIYLLRTSAFYTTIDTSQTMIQLAVFASHPVQYKAPLYRCIADTEEIDLTVYYGSKHGVSSTDLGFDQEQTWDLPLLEGYEYEFLTNYARSDSPAGFLSLINPSLLSVVDSSFDVLLIHTGYYRVSSLLAVLGAKIHGVPVLLHGTGHEHALPFHLAVAKQVYVRTFLSGVNRVMADCTANKRYYQQYGVPPENITIMPAAVDNERFRGVREAIDDAELSSLRDELDIPDSDTIVLYVGKLIERKRVRDLVRAFSRLPSDIDASLVIVGDGVERESLRDLSQEYGLDRIVFAGFRDQRELPLFYEMGDMFVLPSRYDPSPKVLNESMLFELPIITTDGVGSAEDLVENNGDIYPAGDIEALTDLLRRYLNGDIELETRGRRSEEIIDDWDYEADIEALREAFSEMKII